MQRGHLKCTVVQPNDRLQPLQEVGARHERTLVAVGWKPVLGDEMLCMMQKDVLAKFVHLRLKPIRSHPVATD